MSAVRLGAVGYLNARPLVCGLDRLSRFTVRFDLPSRCAELLHGGGIDVGLIPSIEYLRGPAEGGSQAEEGYRIVPDVAIASRGPVESVALYITRSIADVRSIAMDTSSRTSVALARVLCARAFRIQPEIVAHHPNLPAMLATADAALIIGDNALFADQATVKLTESAIATSGFMRRRKADASGDVVGEVEKIDLGEIWTRMTGLPFVYAFWAGRPGVLGSEDVEALHVAKDEGLKRTEAIVEEYFNGSPERRAVGLKYLRDNIKYDFGADERAGLELFYRYAAEAGLVEASAGLRFY